MRNTARRVPKSWPKLSQSHWEHWKQVTQNIFSSDSLELDDCVLRALWRLEQITMTYPGQRWLMWLIPCADVFPWSLRETWRKASGREDLLWEYHVLWDRWIGEEERKKKKKGKGGWVLSMENSCKKSSPWKYDHISELESRNALRQIWGRV